MNFVQKTFNVVASPRRGWRKLKKFLKFNLKKLKKP